MSEPSSLPSTIGLIAGEGAFPFIVLDEAARHGIEVVTLAIEGEADPELAKKAAGPFHTIGIGQLSKCVRIFGDAGISRAIMAGRVRHVSAFHILRPDRLTLKVLSRLSSRSTDEMLKTLAEVLGEEGVELVDSTLLLRSHLMTKGPMTKRGPNKRERLDFVFGVEMARGLAELDIGQTVIVKNKTVVAAEAMEGTDAAVLRAGDVVEGPLTVVKVARPQQDMRFDVPVIGPTTIDSMTASGATALGLETGRVLLLEREALLRNADERAITVVGI